MLNEVNMKELLSQEIFKININADMNSIGESLDSLDRIELIENLEIILGVELHHLVNDKIFWSNLEQSSEILTKEIK